MCEIYIILRHQTKGSMVFRNLKALGCSTTQEGPTKGLRVSKYLDPVGQACLTDLDYSNSHYVTTYNLVKIMYTSCNHLQF